MSKGSLAKALSSLHGFKSPKVRDEQYTTPGEIAAKLLWMAQMHQDLAGKKVCDLGAGTGILGIGAALLGSAVTLVDKDPDALAIAQENASALGITVHTITSEVTSYNIPADTVIMNPPFGTKNKHADTLFLAQAFTLANHVYSIHKASTDDYIRNYAEMRGFATTHALPEKMMLPKTQKYHSKPKTLIDVVIYRFIPLQSL